MFVDIILEFLLVTFGNGNVVFPEHNAPLVDDGNLAFLHDERAVHAQESRGGQPLFEGSQADQGEDGAGLVFEVDLHIVFQAFDVADLVQRNLHQFVVAFHIR